MEKVWLANYPAGVPVEINPEAFGSIVEVVEQSCKRFANRPAYAFMGKTITYAELDRLSAQFASYLQNVAGLKPGDRIAMQMPNVMQYPVAMFGALRAGLVVVNINPLYTPREMKYHLTDSGAKAIVILANFANNLEQIVAETEVKKVIVTEIGDMLGGLKGGVVNFVVKYVKRMVPKYHLPEAVHFNTALKQGAQHDLRTPAIKGADMAFIQYTGGTTGVSKGAVLTHRNIVANMEQMSAWLPVEPGKEIVITPLPLYHIYALTVSAMCFMKVGALNVLIPNPRDMKAFLSEVAKWKFTAMSGLNTLFVGMMNHPLFSKIDWQYCRIVSAGGMALQRPVAERFTKLTGVQIIEGYGMTETSPVTHSNPLISGEPRLGSIGMPLPSTEIRIIDEDGNDVPQGERGELCIRGPQVMQGYWQKPEENAKVFLGDGYLRTGDIAMMDPDGYFRIVDRKKDMINVSGFKVFPNEVEDVVAGHPGVLEVAAIGVPSEKTGEAVMLFVVKKDPALTLDDVKNYCHENLTAYKRPSIIEFRDELPKSNVGKILRRPLREEAIAKLENASA